MTVRIFNGTVISSSVAVLLSWAATVLIIVYKLKLSGSQVWNLILYSLLIVVPLLVLMILISFGIASRVTKGIINKIEKMGDDVEHIKDNCNFVELSPFVEKIQLQLEEKEKLAKVKKKFTANVSHELKTPLTAISGYGELLQSQMVSPKDTAEIGAVIYKESQRLINLTHDIIQLSQLEEYDYKPIIDAVDVYDVASSCIKALFAQAGKKDVTLNLTGSSVAVKGTRALIEDVVYNLVENAIKYNKNGGSVFVDIKDDNDKCILSVKDTGIGIPEKYLSHVFERFFRVDKSRSKETGGTGLGLAIVKHTAEYLGGSATVKSKLDEGTEFIITLPKP